MQQQPTEKPPFVRLDDCACIELNYHHHSWTLDSTGLSFQEDETCRSIHERMRSKKGLQRVRAAIETSFVVCVILQAIGLRWRLFDYNNNNKVNLKNIANRKIAIFESCCNGVTIPDDSGLEPCHTSHLVSSFPAPTELRNERTQSFLFQRFIINIVAHHDERQPNYYDIVGTAVLSQTRWSGLGAAATLKH